MVCCAQVVILTYIPVCGETLWIDQFLLCSGLFAMVALLETCFVLFLAYHIDDHLVPEWILPPNWALVKIAWLLGESRVPVAT